MEHMKSTGAGKTMRWLWLALAFSAALSACSSTPKRPQENLERRNHAAEIAKLGDETLAKGKTAEAIQLYTLSVQ